MHSLIEILQDGQFHSGEELGERLAISRAGVWKKLQRLEADYGLQIVAIKGRGYCLKHPLSLLNSQRLNQADLGLDVYCVESLVSTNTYAQSLAKESPAKSFAVLAERQTSGRGRRGRQWQSPYAENLYLSLVVPITGGLRQLEGISLVVGLAVLNTLKAFGIKDAGVKWPNDVLVADKKIAGVLLELSGDPADCASLVIGIGLNVNMQEDSAITQAWTSMAVELGALLDRNQVSIALLRQLNVTLERFFADSFSSFKCEWEADHLWQGKEALLSSGEHVIHGTIMGVDDGGALRLCVEGVERVFSGGELSLRLAHDS